MCGIAGVIDLLQDSQRDATDLQRMLDRLRHRGPDHRGTFLGPRAALGVQRLSVVDVETGHQPISNEECTVHFVSNGELYYHAELREQLIAEGHRFSTHADTEILVHSYETWGFGGLLERIDGMFAFVLHDERFATTFIARDRLGIKPLVYCRSGRTGAGGPRGVFRSRGDRSGESARLSGAGVRGPVVLPLCQS